MPIYKDEYPDGISKNFWQRFVLPNIRELKGGRCERCGSTENLDVHHTDYDTLVNIDTLRLFCRKCHKAAHKEMKNEPNPNPQ